MGRFDRLDTEAQRIVSKVEAAYTGLMQSLTDEAKEGPRLFSFEPVDPGFFDRPDVDQPKVPPHRCGASIQPPAAIGVEWLRQQGAACMTLNLPREWLEKAAPFLKVLTGTLSLVLPVAASATKLVHG